MRCLHYPRLMIRTAPQGMSALDKKEALLVQLRNMNDEAAAGMHNAKESAARHTPAFQRAYAAVVMQVSLH